MTRTAFPDAEAAPMPSPRPAGPADEPVVLVAEDDESVREAVAVRLAGEGWRVEEVADGNVLLARADEVRPDLIVLDRVLPGLSGDEVLAAIRSVPWGASVGVIVLSGRSDAVERAALLRAGADDYVAKPFDSNELAARAAAILRRARAPTGPLLAAYVEAREAEREIAVAREVCESLQAAPPEIPGFRFAQILRPAARVGGDFLEYLADHRGNPVVVLGDVQGHGLGAALWMVMLRTLVRSAAAEEVPFAEVLPRIDRFLRREGRQGMDGRPLVSLLLLHLDPRRERWRLATAGAPPPLLRRGLETRPLDEEGRPSLGIAADGSWPIAGGDLRRGDLVVAFTDGLLEALAPKDPRRGIEEARRIVGESAGAADAIRRIGEALPEVVADDASAVAVEIA